MKTERSETLGAVLKNCFKRPSLLTGFAKALPVAVFAAGVKPAEGVSSAATTQAVAATKDFRLGFASIAPSKEDFITVADGYRVGVIAK